MRNIAELPTKDTIALIINRKNVDKVTYVFKNRYGNKIGEYENRSPATLSSGAMSQGNTNRSSIRKEI